VIHQWRCTRRAGCSDYDPAAASRAPLFRNDADDVCVVRNHAAANNSTGFYVSTVVAMKAQSSLFLPRLSTRRVVLVESRETGVVSR